MAIRNTLGGSATFVQAVIEYASQAISVECCTDSAPAVVKRSKLQHNQTALAGYAGVSIQVDDSEITDNTCGADSAYKTFNRCKLNGNDQAVCETENVSLFDCEVSGNRVGLSGRMGSVQRTRITKNTELGVTGGFALSNNLISGNGVGILVPDGDGKVDIANNSICNNVSYGLKLETAANVAVENNWWCTTDRNAIAAAILDIWDDINLGVVDFEPFLSAPSPNAPAP
jgi:hypothetical protein